MCMKAYVSIMEFGTGKLVGYCFSQPVRDILAASPAPSYLCSYICYLCFVYICHASYTPSAFTLSWWSMTTDSFITSGLFRPLPGNRVESYHLGSSSSWRGRILTRAFSYESVQSWRFAISLTIVPRWLRICGIARGTAWHIRVFRTLNSRIPLARVNRPQCNANITPKQVLPIFLIECPLRSIRMIVIIKQTSSNKR